MRASIRCLVLGTLVFAALRHLGGWPHAAMPLRPGGPGWWGVLSFALAAVVDIDRAD